MEFVDAVDPSADAASWLSESSANGRIEIEIVPRTSGESGVGVTVTPSVVSSFFVSVEGIAELYRNASLRKTG